MKKEEETNAMYDEVCYNDHLKNLTITNRYYFRFIRLRRIMESPGTLVRFRQSIIQT
jgi:hypothetical protein